MIIYSEGGKKRKKNHWKSTALTSKYNEIRVLRPLPTPICLDWVIFLNDSRTPILFPEEAISPAFSWEDFSVADISNCIVFQFSIVLSFWGDNGIMLTWILDVLIPTSRILWPDLKSWSVSLLLMEQVSESLFQQVCLLKK